MSEVLDQSIRYHPVPRDEYRANLARYGMSQGFLQGIVDIVRAQNDGISDTGEGPRHPGGRTSFGEWCEQSLKHAVQA